MIGLLFFLVFKKELVVELILGLLFLQIVLESLPISSSGHLLFYQRFFHVSASDLLEDLVHGPTILIVAVFFWREWTAILWRLGDIRKFGRSSYQNLLALVSRIVLAVFVIGCVTAFFYLFIRVLGKDFLLPFSSHLLVLGLVVTAGALFSLRWRNKTAVAKTEPPSLDCRTIVILGCVQGIALLPGVSRFGVTYVASRWLSFSPRRAMQLSFLIQVPLLIAAFLRGCWKLVKGEVVEELLLVCSWNLLLVGILATALGYVAFVFAWRLAMQKKFWLIGFYVSFVAVAFMLYSFL